MPPAPESRAETGTEMGGRGMASVLKRPAAVPMPPPLRPPSPSPLAKPTPSRRPRPRTTTPLPHSSADRGPVAAGLAAGGVHRADQAAMDPYPLGWRDDAIPHQFIKGGIEAAGRQAAALGRRRSQRLLGHWLGGAGRRDRAGLLDRGRRRWRQGRRHRRGRCGFGGCSCWLAGLGRLAFGQHQGHGRQGSRGQQAQEQKLKRLGGHGKQGSGSSERGRTTGAGQRQAGASCRRNCCVPGGADRSGRGARVRRRDGGLEWDQLGR